jgi:hypothetical protein
MKTPLASVPHVLFPGINEDIIQKDPYKVILLEYNIDEAHEYC